jgi:hypothetical protein
MACTTVFNRADPCIAIVLVGTGPGHPVRARGWYGSCTQCGKPVHRWNRDQAVVSAQRHVDAHEPVLLGGDTDALVK